MIYVYFTEELDEDIVKKILESGLAVSVDKEDNIYLLSKEKEFNVDGNTIMYQYSLEEYISMLDGGEYFNINGMEITKTDVIGYLLEKLYDGNESYADMIYNSENPHEQINKIIDEFVIIRLEQLAKEFRKRINSMKKYIEKNGVEWQ